MGELMTGTIRDNLRDNYPQAVRDKGTTGTKPFRVVPVVPAVPAAPRDAVNDTFDHDLSPVFTPDTATAIRDAWITRRDNLDPQPIRDAYRANPHARFRALIAHMMTEEQA